MIDFHSHILPGIDDGSQSLEESEQMLYEAKQYGFDKVVSTSHYAIDCYEVPEYKRKELLDELRHFKDIPELILGSEIFITYNIVALLKEYNASTINNTNYVLFELPLRKHFSNLNDVVVKLKENNYRLIIAHPERYWEVQDNYNFLYELQDMGILFQVNYASFVGYYGFRAKRVAKKMLRDGLISFMGTDVHFPNSIYPLVPKVLKKMRKLVSEEYIEDITNNNIEKVLNNEDI